MSSKGKLKCREVSFVLHFHVPNKELFPEEYTHHLLFLYFPFRNEAEVKYRNSYSEKFNLPGLVETINMNRIKVEPYASIVDDALDQLATNCESNIESYDDQEDDETCELNYSSENEDLISTDDQANCIPEFENLTNTTLPCFSDLVIN